MHLTKREKEPWVKINIIKKEVVDAALSYMRTKHEKNVEISE